MGLWAALALASGSALRFCACGIVTTISSATGQPPDSGPEPRDRGVATSSRVSWLSNSPSLCVTTTLYNHVTHLSPEVEARSRPAPASRLAPSR